MKTSTITLLLVILIHFSSQNIFAQNSIQKKFDKEWLQVEKYIEKDRPKSALKVVEKLLTEAQKEKNYPQIIKSIMYKTRFEMERNMEKTPKLIQEFEQSANNMNDTASQAIMHLMTAKMYEEYYLQEYYKICMRTDIKGYKPENIDEWAENIFLDKIQEQIRLTLKNKNLLQKTNTLDYDDILHKGEDSRILKPTLFDFLAYESIEIIRTINTPNKYLEINNIYQQIIEFNKQKNNQSALFYATLQQLQHQYKNTPQYISKLQQIILQYAQYPIVVEAIYLQALQLIQQSKKQKAYKIIEKAIPKYSAYKRIDLLISLKNDLEQKYIYSMAYNLVRPKSKLTIKLISKNIEKIQLIVYKIDATAKTYYKYREYNDDKSELYPKHTKVYTKNIIVEPNKNFDEVKTTTTIPTDEYGIYELVISEQNNNKNGKKIIQKYVVTDFTYIYRNKSNDTSDIFVLDRTSGRGIKDVNIEGYEEKWEDEKNKLKLVINTKTGKKGFANIQNKDGYDILFLKKGKDVFFSSWFATHYNNYQCTPAQEYTSLFSDRSVYRPGQTVYFKGITYQYKTQTVLENKEISVTLHNVNGKKIAEKKLKTNQFGSFADYFVLPTDQLNGGYSIKTSDNAILHILVEAYKRPTFEVRIDKPDKETRFGETIQVRGKVKAYAGYNVTNAVVKYRIVKQMHTYCCPYTIYPMDQKNIANGTTKSKSDGTFEISFVPKKETKNNDYDQFYTYTIYTEVTDSKGETQQGEQNISVGEKSLFILPNIPSKIEKNKPTKLNITLQTINGKTITKNIDYKIIKLKPSDKYYENTHDTTTYQTLSIVKKGRFNTKDSLTLKLQKLKSGLYKIIFSTQDDKEKKVEVEKKFVLYSNSDKRPPIKTYRWFIPIKTKVEVGESAIVKFGTSTTHTQVLYEIMDGNRPIVRKWIEFNNETKTFLIPFKKSYKKGIHLLLTFVKDEQLFTLKVQIERANTKKELPLNFSVFRDKLRPGEKTKWTVHIPSTSQYQQAELLIAMYDASLDAIRKNQWYFTPIHKSYIPPTQYWTMEKRKYIYEYITINKKTYRNIKPYIFDAINWFELRSGRFQRVSYVGSMESMEEKMASKNSTEDEIQISEDIVTLDNQNDIVQENNHSKEVQIRENFNETAFFYPQLHNDKNGNIDIEFTAPESLTRWHINILAHTSNLFYHTQQIDAITQKELMIQMNMPRFIRKSDILTLTSNLTNLTNQPQVAELTFEIIDPNTNKTIFRQQKNQSIDIAPKQTIPIQWKLPKIASYDMVICKIIAKNEQFSDGEQKYLPILPDKIQVTESMPMTVRNNSTKTFDFQRFTDNFTKVKTSNFIIEYTNNPIWYAIQALPTLSTPTEENAIEYLTAYYTNTLAKHIIDTQPNISSILKMWENETDKKTEKDLYSNLEKKQTLKNIPLSETPWIRDAKNETEQKKQIATLLHTNQQKKQSEMMLHKLFLFQAPNGGFRWFQGMPESRYITQEIIFQLARAKKITQNSYSEKDNQKIIKSIQYLDRQITKDYNYLKKNQPGDYKTKNLISPIQISYLYIRSLYPTIKMAANTNDAIKYYTAQTEKYWTSFSLYLRSLTAMIAHKNGKTKIAKDILTSLKENALTDEQSGMYWTKNTAGIQWNERPIDTQTSIIEAFEMIENDTTSIENMKIWLLKQKQTQQWNTPISTINAIYTLLNKGNNWLEDNQSTILSVGNKTFTTKQNKTNNTGGYIKKHIPNEQLQPKTGKITIQNQSKKGIGWGAIYWQYYQEIDKITATEDKKMKITKKLFVEKQQNGQKIIIPITQKKLKKGDKIITRLTLKTEQDMQFVSLNDLRAGCLEPTQQISETIWKEGIIYYQSYKDTSTTLFFHFLPKGTYVFEYTSWVNNTGTFTSGIASVQCQYAPEFISHTRGEKIIIQ